MPLDLGDAQVAPRVGDREVRRLPVARDIVAEDLVGEDVGVFGEGRVSERTGDESPGPLPTTPPKSPVPDLLVDEDDALDGQGLPSQGSGLKRSLGGESGDESSEKRRREQSDVGFNTGMPGM